MGQPSSRSDELVKSTALTVGKEYAKLSGADRIVGDVTLLANPATSSLVLAPEIAQDSKGFVEGEAIGAGAGFILQTAIKATGGRLRKLGSGLFRLFGRKGDEVTESITKAEKRLDADAIEARPSTNPSANAPTTEVANKPVSPGDSGSYGGLKGQKKAHGETEPMDMDHRPSYAAQKKSLENKLGRELTPQEAKALKDSTPAVATPRMDHQKKSRTYGGRNNQEQIEMDAADLERARRLDDERFR
jgi:hypothetical protein